MHKRTLFFLICVLSLLLTQCEFPVTTTPVTELAGPCEATPPPGPHTSPNPADFASLETFTHDDKLVATYYFYWYDAAQEDDPERGINTHLEQRIHHEPDERPEVFTWRNPDWHARHLRDMLAARIDIMLPVYWGVPCEAGYGYLTQSSQEGLQNLVQAQEDLLRAGERPPKIGMFYDTGSLGVGTTYFDSYMRDTPAGFRADLTSAVGMERFYLPIRDFYSLIPPEMWAMIDGKPIVWLYNTGWVFDYNGETFRYVKERFAEDFGGMEPYIVREKSWQADKVKIDGEWMTDNAYTWGVSLYGYDRIHTIAALGPGYDESAQEDRYCAGKYALPTCTPCPGEDTTGVGCPRIRDRAGGDWYAGEWQKVLDARDQVNIVVIEVWNEYHEGNSIAETQEFGRLYIDLTAEYAARFRAQRPVPVTATPMPTSTPLPTPTPKPLVSQSAWSHKVPIIMISNQSERDIVVNEFQCQGVDIYGDPLTIIWPTNIIIPPDGLKEYRQLGGMETCDGLINKDSLNPIPFHIVLESYQQYQITVTDAYIQSASAQPISNPNPPAGRWQGPVNQPGAAPYTAVMTLENCSPQTTCGSIDYPELSCGGTLTLLTAENNQYTFREKMTYGTDKCADEGVITLQANADGTWGYRWYHSSYMARQRLCWKRQNKHL